MYKVKRFSELSKSGRIKRAIGGALYAGAASTIPGTILGYLLGGAAGLITRNKGWAKKGAAIGGGLTGLLGAYGGAKMSLYMTSPEYQKKEKERDERIMKEKLTKKYPKESSSTIIKYIKETEKSLGFKLPDQLYKLAKIQSDFNNEYFPQWDRVEAWPPDYADVIPQIALQYNDPVSEYKDTGGIMLLSGIDDGGDWLYWYPEEDEYIFENWHKGVFKSIKDAMLSYLSTQMKYFDQDINKSKNEDEKGRLRIYRGIIAEYKYRIGGL